MRGEGLELVAIGHTSWFPVEYDFADKKYRDNKGKVRLEVMDVSCMSCGRGYYTLEFDEVPFCPFCGTVERRRFLMLSELEEFLREQNWGYLDTIGWKPFAVTTGNDWQLRFAADQNELQKKRHYHEIHLLRPEKK